MRRIALLAVVVLTGCSTDDSATIAVAAATTTTVAPTTTVGVGDLRACATFETASREARSRLAVVAEATEFDHDQMRDLANSHRDAAGAALDDATGDHMVELLGDLRNEMSELLDDVEADRARYTDQATFVTNLDIFTIVSSLKGTHSSIEAWCGRSGATIDLRVQTIASENGG